MEAAELGGDFWESREPVAPGATLPAEAGRLPAGLGAVLFRSSGSSGEPKWIVHTRHSLRASADAVNRHLGVTAGHCWGLVLPLHHVGGFGVVARVAAAGCRLAGFGERWDAPRFARWLDGAGVSHLSLVPTQVHDLVTAGLRAPGSLEAVVVGGGRLGREAGAAARRLGWPVLASYGSSEAGSQVATQSPDGSPYDPDRLRILDAWRVRTDPGGQLEFTGPALFLGTLGQAGLERRSTGWFRSGDLGVVDGGFLHMTGRADRLVKILGELVDPEQVERALGIDGLVVVAVPDARAGSRLLGVHAGLAGEDLAKLAEKNKQIAGYQRLSEIVEVPEIPRGSLGKVRRGELAEWFSKKDNQ